MVTIVNNVCVCSVIQPCPILCDPMDCSPPGSSVHGILQARILEWVAIFFFSGIFQTAQYTWNFLRIDLKHSHQKEKIWPYEVMKVLIYLIAVIISQCMYISNHHIVYFSYIQFYVNHTSIKVGGNYKLYLVCNISLVLRTI